MRVNSGSEIHPKRCKSSLTQALPSLGYFQKNAKKENALPEMADTIKAFQLLFMKMRRLDKLFNTEKEKFWDIQPQTEYASAKITTTVSITCLSLLLSTLLI